MRLPNHPAKAAGMLFGIAIALWLLTGLLPRSKDIGRDDRESDNQPSKTVSQLAQQSPAATPRNAKSVDQTSPTNKPPQGSHDEVPLKACSAYYSLTQVAQQLCMSAPEGQAPSLAFRLGSTPLRLRIQSLSILERLS